jgi:hypothetical protein
MIGFLFFDGSMQIIGMAVAVEIGCARTVDQPVTRRLVSLVPRSMGVGRALVDRAMDRTAEAAMRAVSLTASAGGPNLIDAPKSFLHSFLHVSSTAP